MDFDQLARNLLRLRAEMPVITSKTLTTAGLKMEQLGKQNAAARMRTRSGTLVRSIRAKVDGQTLTLAANASGADLVYASTQERGATVRPVNKKWLTVPVPGGPALTPAGVHRYKTARDFPGGLRFVFLSPVRALLVQERRNRSEIVYILLKKTVIRPKWFMRDAFDDVAPKVEGALSARILSVLRGK